MRKERGKECEKFKFFASMPTNSRRSSAGEEWGEGERGQACVRKERGKECEKKGGERGEGGRTGAGRLQGVG